MPIAASLLKEYDAEDVVAAALKLMQEGNKALEASPEDILAKDLSNTGGRPGIGSSFHEILDAAKSYCSGYSSNYCY